ncbi:cell division protein FtsQ [Gammaproteobacteria bacterium]|nr:cell division protein FtsQ [Gammaproteobacteria bacterium]
MLNFKYFYFLCILIIISGCSKNKDIEIFFNDGFVYKAQNELISELKSLHSRKDIKNALLQQDWIKDFKIDFRINGNIKIILDTKNPIFIWNEKYYVDSDVNTFKFDHTNTSLAQVFCPSNQLNEARNLIDSIKNKESLKDLQLIKLNFKYSSGWTLFLANKTTIKFGKDISAERLHVFEQTMNYIYENKSIPSMIDLRYKDGVALNYGK